MIRWKKGPFTALKLRVNRGPGPEFLAVDTEPDYVDTVKPAAGQTAVYKYQGIYLICDAEYGQWSDWIEITVTG